MGNVFTAEGCVFSLGQGTGPTAPLRLRWNSSQKKWTFHWESFWEEIYLGTENKFPGGGTQSQIRRKVSSLFCSPRVMGARGLQTQGAPQAACTYGCKAGRLYWAWKMAEGLGHGSKSLPTRHCLHPNLQESSLPVNSLWGMMGKGYYGKSRKGDTPAKRRAVVAVEETVTC